MIVKSEEVQKCEGEEGAGGRSADSGRNLSYSNTWNGGCGW